ncbi:serine/threonine protein kinase [Pendulispora rubella]|uniref:non-specific serine/threonine protein kinase n=1 Tax=Pendulispora rubella TaxID=2741070 RepID=A0ABZ2LDW4_9BACT
MPPPVSAPPPSVPRPPAPPAAPPAPPIPYAHPHPGSNPGPPPSSQPRAVPPPRHATTAPLTHPSSQNFAAGSVTLAGLPPMQTHPGAASAPPAGPGGQGSPTLHGHGFHTTPPMPMPRITVQYPQVGAVLTSARGNYEVRSIVGSGEFGAVYECVGPFDQVYAVKMIRPANRPHGEVHAEWAREVQRLMLLRHPNVVFIYDAFEQNFLYYLALERCDHPLTAMLGPPMQEGLVIELARQLLAAVQFLHDNDIVHDDLHPGNVLISHADRPIVKISDFGISHELRGQSAIRPNVVHHKIMAPEVVAAGYTSKQSDLYQVGLLLYWMLTGSPALAAGLPYQELIRQVGGGEPRRRAEQIGTPLGHLIAKMLRRREAYRYTSAREVWADLRALPAWQNRDLFRDT